MNDQTLVNNSNQSSLSRTLSLITYLDKDIDEVAELSFESNKRFFYVVRSSKYKSEYEATKGIIKEYLMRTVINGKYMDIVTSEDETRWRQFTSMIMSDDELLIQSIEAFVSYEEICEIYYCIEESYVELFILLNNDSYNFELMHQLYNIERLVKRMWDGRFVEFHYAPEKYLDKKFLSNYHIVYKRG